MTSIRHAAAHGFPPCLAGAAVFGCWLTWMLLLGWHSASVCAFAAAMAICFVLGRRLTDMPAIGEISLGVMAAWTALFPFLGWMAVSVLDLLPLSLQESTLSLFVTLTGVTVLGWFPMWASLLAHIGSAHGDRAVAGAWGVRGSDVWLSAAMAGGILAASTATGMGISATALRSLAALGLAVCMAERLMRSAEPIFATSGGNAAGGRLDPRIPELVLPLRRAEVSLLLSAFGIGAAVYGTSRITSQWFLNAPYLIAAAWAAFLIGVSLRTWLIRHGRNWDTACSIAAVLAPALAVVLYPTAVELVLWQNAHVSAVLWQSVLRSAAVGLFALPLGLAFGGVLSQAPLPYAAAAGVAGFVLATLFAISPAVAVAGAVVTMAAAYLVRHPILTLARTSRRPRWSAVAIAAVAIGCCIFVGNYRPDRAARVLFSTNATLAGQNGFDTQLLTAIDDGRLIATVESADGTWTAWRHQGSQLQCRFDGVPTGAFNTAPSLHASYTGSVLALVTPFVITERPEHLLVVGLNDGEAVRLGRGFPLISVTCIEPSAAKVELAEQVWPALQQLRSTDRVRFRQIQPETGVDRLAQPFDIVILNDPQASCLRQQSQLTANYYRRVADAVSRDGIVCQRFGTIDFESDALETAIATMRLVFPQVSVVEVAPGEVLLLASHRTEPLFDEKALERLETPHIRDAMAQVGWDWSILTNLTSIAPEETTKIATARGEVNSAENGGFTATAAFDVMRWSAKWQDYQEFLAQHRSRPLDWIGQSDALAESDAVADVAARLADVKRTREILWEHPDHFWAYRKSLKERLKERPRSAIQQVKHEGLKRRLHPEDQNRKDYLVTLAGFLALESPTAKDVARVLNHASPYDPLLTTFLSGEVAMRLQQTDALPDQELAHRLRAVYFADPADRSVRHIVRSLELIVEHPDLLTDPASRWDVVNGLLEMLRVRWTMRSQDSARASQYDLVDAEASLAVAKRSLHALESWQADADVDVAYWEARQKVLDRLLLDGLRMHRNEQSRKIASRKSAVAKAREASATPPAANSSER